MKRERAVAKKRLLEGPCGSQNLPKRTTPIDRSTFSAPSPIHHARDSGRKRKTTPDGKSATEERDIPALAEYVRKKKKQPGRKRGSPLSQEELDNQDMAAEENPDVLLSMDDDYGEKKEHGQVMFSVLMA